MKDVLDFLGGLSVGILLGIIIYTVGRCLLERLKRAPKEPIDTFTVEHTCAHCELVLTNQERMHSGGVCPYCGWVSDGTICATNKTSKRKEKA